MRFGTVDEMSELKPEMVGIRQDRRYARWQDARAARLYSWAHFPAFIGGNEPPTIENLDPLRNDKRWERTPKAPKGHAWPSIIEDEWALARRTNVHVYANNRHPWRCRIIYGVHR